MIWRGCLLSPSLNIEHAVTVSSIYIEQHQLYILIIFLNIGVMENKICIEPKSEVVAKNVIF